MIKILNKYNIIIIIHYTKPLNKVFSTKKIYINFESKYDKIWNYNRIIAHCVSDANKNY